MDIRYLIIGAGGIGGSVGGFLESGGYDVSFIARGRTLEALKREGLRISSGIKGQLHLKDIKAFSSGEYDQKADVIFVCVKDYSLDSIIPVIKKAVHERSIIIPLLNGFGVGDRIREKLDLGHVADGCIYISAFIDSPGSIIQLGNLFKIVFGYKKDTNLNDDLLNNIKTTLSSCGIETILSDEIEAEIFKKFSFVSSCGACGAYYDVAAGSMQVEGKCRETFLGLCNEVEEIGNKLDFKLDPDLISINLKILDSLTPDTTASLQKDLKAGKESEVDSLIFSVVRLADRLGVDAPFYRMVAEKLAVTYWEDIC